MAWSQRRERELWRNSMSQKTYRAWIPAVNNKAFMDCPLVLVEGFPLTIREYDGKPMTRTDANWRVN